MPDTPTQATLPQRIHECEALADSTFGSERERYLAEAEGLKEAAAGQPENRHRFTDPERQAAYERGRADGLALLTIS